MTEKPDPREPLVAAAMDLRAAAPDQWARFVAEIGKEAVRSNGRMVSVDPSLLMRAQGMAIQANAIAATLQDAPTLHEQFYQARMKRNAGTNSR